MTKKENERAANHFDMRLYALIAEARSRAEAGDAFSDKWRTLQWALIDARPTARVMMHPGDRAKTS